MKESISLQLVWQAAAFAVGALVVALPLHDWLRKRQLRLAAQKNEPPPLPEWIDAAAEPPKGKELNIIDLIFALGVVAFFLTTLAGQVAMVAKGKAAADPGASATQNVLNVLASGLVQLMLLSSVVAFLKVIQGRSVRQWFGLASPDQGSAIRVGLGVGILACIALTFVGAWIDQYWLSPRGLGQQAQDVVKAFGASSPALIKAAMVLMAVVIAPVVEEVIFRGMLYPIFKHFTSGIFAALFTGILFGCIHGNLAALVPLSLLGMFLCRLKEQTGTLAAPIAAHACFNAVSVFGILRGWGGAG